ncbi:stage VI sporulation protein D [Halobacillus andaensis]|uniref:Stage VI sporulation protein D n=1 Tax=Halobacillus andaensis TaxID=1176239 RepID=A0A917EUI0_HALAA|nr:LysM peptidoglycan-binding domain-containing protein [Halobacillus andaensis]MBP2002939.1 stage VI sporulation protein D [Halobacillus andaensis]GGF06760.1 stage VI sporulation protein D [Halobacillus andaensis]
MQNNQEFSFYLDESLWFKEGQGVSELIGISLEPNVSIADLGDEVRLHGTVELFGEYMANEKIEPYRNADTPPVGRVLEVDDGEEEGVSEFTHSFPVEITVSKDRVANLEEVVIDIETFDYELPEPNNLTLHAQLSMNGILQERSTDPLEEEHNVITIGPVQYKDEEQEATAGEEFREEDNVDQEESGRKEHTQSFSDFFKPQMAEEVEENEQEFTDQEEGAEPYEEVESAEVEQDEPSPSVNGFKQIFQHLFPNRDETYSQMKMYIVQEDETIEMIAERYEVPVKQLEKVNQVEEEVAPGQIVYIPN